MDSDDYLENDALELCFEKAESNNLDFVLFDAEILNPIRYYGHRYYIPKDTNYG